MPEPEARVHHHVLLQRRGGVAKVARTLLTLQGAGARLSYEVEEPGNTSGGQTGPAGERCGPGQLAAAAPQGWLVHAHATRDWHALLAGFAAASRPLVVTAHDCSLITGGCVYPVTCPHHAKACLDPCPRGYPESQANRALKRELVAAARPLLASPSSWLAAQLRAEWPGLVVKVVPNGVDVPAARPDKASARARLGIAPTARVALFLAHGGVQAVYKGGDRVEALLARLAELVPGFLGIVAGGERARRDGAALHFPYVEDEALERLFEASDALVYPTLADNHPLVVLEAMARGLPVASYAVGGITEQVADGETGVLAPPHHDEALALAAAGVLANPGLARSLGVNARARAERLFTASRMARDYAGVYALARRAGSPGS